MTEGTLVYNGWFDGIDMTIFTGPIVRLDPAFEERTDYAIDAAAFGKFVDTWQ
jgi:hypothetical protein